MKQSQLVSPALRKKIDIATRNCPREAFLVPYEAGSRVGEIDHERYLACWSHGNENFQNFEGYSDT